MRVCIVTPLYYSLSDGARFVKCGERHFGTACVVLETSCVFSPLHRTIRGKYTMENFLQGSKRDGVPHHPYSLKSTPASGQL